MYECEVNTHVPYFVIGVLGTPKCYLLLRKRLKLYFIIHIAEETEIHCKLVEI